MIPGSALKTALPDLVILCRISSAHCDVASPAATSVFPTPSAANGPIYDIRVFFPPSGSLFLYAWAWSVNLCVSEQCEYGKTPQAYRVTRRPIKNEFV